MSKKYVRRPKTLAKLASRPFFLERLTIRAYAKRNLYASIVRKQDQHTLRARPRDLVQRTTPRPLSCGTVGTGTLLCANVRVTVCVYVIRVRVLLCDSVVGVSRVSCTPTLAFLRVQHVQT